MKRRRCTAFLDDGRTDPPDEGRFGTVDDCLQIVVRAGGRQLEHWVCGDCRLRMDLPG